LRRSGRRLLDRSEIRQRRREKSNVRAAAILNVACRHAPQVIGEPPMSPIRRAVARARDRRPDRMSRSTHYVALAGLLLHGVASCNQTPPSAGPPDVGSTVDAPDDSSASTGLDAGGSSDDSSASTGLDAGGSSDDSSAST